MFVRVQGNVIMSCELETLKTNEFRRRRKLRLQQVREQSKDIAKKVRQRTRNETSRYLKQLDAKIYREHLLNQEKVVNNLENLYANQMKQFGSSHRSASCVNKNEQPLEKLDLSKERGRAAAAHLRQKKQQELDQKKILLERKLRAREAANELSRDKSSGSKQQEKVTNTEENVETEVKKYDEQTIDKVQPSVQFDDAISKETTEDIKEAPQKDKNIQCNTQNLPTERESNVPRLKLQKIDKEASIDTNLHTSETTSEGTKKSNLFAVSDEMPSSLRGGLIHQPSKPPISTKSSLNLVSEYLQTRHMRLREHPVLPSKPIGNLESIRETLMHARANKSKVKPLNTEQIKTCGSTSSARNLVTIYNHTTRDIQNVPIGPEKIVIRESSNDEDAYSQALKESSNSERDGIQLKKVQTTRSRVAMSKQDVEREYKDTIAFLNSLPKDKHVRALKKAYMDEYRQDAQKGVHQRKLQQEFQKIEKECKRVTMEAGRPRETNTGDGTNVHINENCLNVADSMNERYSWIPSPEGDVSFAVHKIPNTTDEIQKCKQNEVNGYHEYRSRHKHTPPTKDMPGKKMNRHSKAAIREEIENQSDESSNTNDDSSSFDDAQLKKPTKKLRKQPSVSAREKIIIYKILSTQNGNVKNKGDETNSDSVNDIIKSLTSIDKVLQNPADDENGKVHRIKDGKKTESSVQPKADHIDEASYKKENPHWKNGQSTKSDDEDGRSSDDKVCRRCQCGKQNDNAVKEKSSNKGPLQWQIDDNNTSSQRSSKGCKECKGMNITTSNTSNVGNPSVPMRSLKSKTSKIVKNVHTHSEAELIKLMEDDADEMNKFYVGASGVLKDEDYEVIIQLRKKNQKEKETHASHQTIDKNVKCGEDNPQLNIIPSTSEEITKNYSNAPAPKTCDAGTQFSKDLSEQKLDIQYSNPSTTTRNPEKMPDVNVNHELSLPTENTTSVSSIPQVTSYLPKSKNVVTKATNASQSHAVVTTCTQTSGRNSPENRSVFVQMSSSTSTTYLSPPERVLPGFLRSRYAEQFNHIDTHHRKKKCKHKHLNQEKVYMNNNNFSKKIETAINIASSDPCHIYNTERIKQMYYNHAPCSKIKRDLRSKVTESNSEPPSKEKMKQRYQRSAHNSGSRVCCKTCFDTGKLKNKDLDNESSGKCSCKPMVPLSLYKVSLRGMEKPPTLRQHTKRKAHLNPVIKNYVRELLNLNQEGLKAIEIAALQCSSVTTPGSSVINEPSNKPVTKEYHGGNIKLTKLEKILSQEKIRNISKKHKTNPSSASSENNFEKPSKVFIRRKLKKKPSGQMMGHKIKSLNISKSILGTKKILRNQRKDKNSFDFDDSCDNSVQKKVFKDAKNSGLEAKSSKVFSISSPTPRPTDCFKLKRIKTASDIGQNQSQKISSNKMKSDEFQSEEKSSKASVISNKTGNIDNITVTAAPDKITIILKPPIEVKSMTKQIKPTVDDKVVQIPSEGEIAFNSKDIKNSADNAIAKALQMNWDKLQELELMKFAQNKLHNMEKIASLTDKCTKRLSNLAKVLEQVRKSKSTAYSHISTTDTSSEIDLKINKNVLLKKDNVDLCSRLNDRAIEAKNNQHQAAPLEGYNGKIDYTELHGSKKAEYSGQTVDHVKNNAEEVNSSKYFHTDKDRTTQTNLDERSLMSVATNTEGVDNILYAENVRLLSNDESQLITSTAMNIEHIPVHASVNTDHNLRAVSNNETVVSAAINSEQSDNEDYVPMLSDIPKPLNLPSKSFLNKEATIHDVYSIVQPESNSKKLGSHIADATGRLRNKPPPALSRVILKTSDEILIPHELSTVIEVDSPISMKYRKQSPTHVSDSKLSHSETLHDDIALKSENEKRIKERNQTNTKLFEKSNLVEKTLISEILEESSQLKMKMINLTKFNEIMLKPFITMEEFAKHCNVGQLDEGSNSEELSRAVTIDEISSLNSDGSMPDIVSELLKRNIISEPFHFDSVSHPNSTTLSSESSLPAFPLSKTNKEKLKSKSVPKTKEHVIVSETSDTLSVSSYPDLENAFKKLGMGWASSTLKKTKQTLCLSSSTSTSNSSASNKYSPKKYSKTENFTDNKENDKKKQHTSMNKPVTVDEFLTNELAEKMTFSSKSNREESEEHFTSLYSTKLPNETNLQVTYPPSVRHSEENVRTNTRQRTSTPVQLFKSETNSSSTSNNRSDGLFSNVDELSSVKLTSSSVKNYSSSEKDELTIPNYSLRMKKDN